MVRSLGADHVIDYTKEDFTQNGQTYDVIFDMVPGKSSFARYKSSLKPNGLYLAGAGGLEAFAQMAWTALTGGKKVIAGMAPDRAERIWFSSKSCLRPGNSNRSLTGAIPWSRLPRRTATRTRGTKGAVLSSQCISINEKE